MLATLLAAVLLQAADAPAITAPPSAPAPAAASDPATPRGAPAQDFDFVAWCHGALTGHMALYQVVKPELISIEQPGEVATDAKNDQLQMQAGRDYLALYTRALNGVDRGHPALQSRRRTAEAQGAAIWDPFKSAPARQQMWAWVGWDLPGRCETASKTLLTPKGRLAAQRSPAPGAPTDPNGPASIDAALNSPPAGPSPDATPALRGPQ